MAAPSAGSNSSGASAVNGSAPVLVQVAPTSNADERKIKAEDDSSEDYSVRPVEDLTALIDAMGSNAKGFALNQEDIINTKPITELDALLNYIGPKSDTRAKKIDKAIRHAKMETTLQQLMLSDDVISSADPNEVQDIFNTLAEISPALATDPGKMGPALKEALQYGSVPINILSDASKLEGQLLKNELDRANVEKSKYSI